MATKPAPRQNPWYPFVDTLFDEHNELRDTIVPALGARLGALEGAGYLTPATAGALYDPLGAAAAAGSNATTAASAALVAEAATRAAADAALNARPYPQLPALLAGRYWLPVSPHGSTTNAGLGINNLRLVPWVLRRTITIDRMGGDIATVGDVGSKVRYGIYADTGLLYPGALVLDAGTINGDSATVQDCPTLGSPLTIVPGIYWIGGAVQSVTTTQPAVRTVNNWLPEVPVPGATTIPTSAAAFFGWTVSGVSGALPANFPVGTTPGGSFPRPHLKVTALP